MFSTESHVLISHILFPKDCLKHPSTPLQLFYLARIMDYSELTLFIIPIITGSISLVSSGTIIVSILRSNVGLKIPYRRIVFGMSIFDFIRALGYAFSSLPVPKGAPGVPGAMGNQGTCDAQGSFLMVGLSGSILYSCSLSIYFLCIVKHNITYKEFQRKYETVLHIVSILGSVPLIGYAFADGAINPFGKKCSMAAYPANCVTHDDIECIRGENAVAYVGLGYGIMAIACYCAICGICISTALMVVRQEIRNRSYMTWVGINVVPNREECALRRFIARIRRRLTGINDYPTQDNGPLATALRRRSTLTGRASRRREKEAKTQAFLYIFGFFITHIFAIILSICRVHGYHYPYMLELATAVFSPFQGFSNIFVYTFPHVAVLRRSNTNYSWWKAFGITILSGGDHDDMDRWRQIRRGSTIATPNTTSCQLWVNIKAALFWRYRDQQDISSSTTTWGDVKDRENDVESQHPEVERQDDNIVMPNNDVDDPDCNDSMGLDDTDVPRTIADYVEEEEPINIDSAVVVDEDKEMDDDGRLFELMYT